MEVHIALIAGLCDIGRSTSKGLTTFDFATILVITLVTGLDVRLSHERFPTPTHSLVFQDTSDKFLDA